MKETDKLSYRQRTCVNVDNNFKELILLRIRMIDKTDFNTEKIVFRGSLLMVQKWRHGVP